MQFIPHHQINFSNGYYKVYRRAKSFSTDIPFHDHLLYGGKDHCNQ